MNDAARSAESFPGRAFGSMSALTHALAVRNAYREESATPRAAAPHLQAAAEALAMALLCLEEGDGRGDRRWRAEQARGLLAEAARSLSQARVYEPRIRTLAMPFVMASEARPEAELSRLHHIATRLSFQNHPFLPARQKASPLAPEDEAQLAVVVADLTPPARLAQALRNRWAITALGLAVAGPMLGAPLLAATLAVGTMVAGLWRANHQGDPARDEGEPVHEPSA